MGLKVLFVDDTKLFRRNAEQVLRAGGYEPLVAGDGVEALAVLAQEHREIRLVFADWNMPNMDGFELLVHIKKHPDYRVIPVVMVTSESEKTHINKAIEAGAADYLVKPCANDDLLAKARRILGG